jgi:hypothetical protein
VVLQNGMDLLKGELLGSSTKTCVTSTVIGEEVTGIEAERVSYIKEEELEPTTIPEIKMEPTVSCVSVVTVCTFLVGCIQYCLLLYQYVLKQNFDSREWIFSIIKMR